MPMALVCFAIAFIIAVGTLRVFFEMQEEEMFGFEGVVLLVFAGMFFFILVYGGFANLRARKARIRALKTSPVKAEITLTKEVIKNNNNQYYMRITINDVSWNAQIIYSKKYVDHFGKTINGVAWVDPETGLPMIAEIRGIRIKPVAGIRICSPSTPE